MLQNKVRSLALLVTSALLPLSAQAQINMQQSAEQTFSIITSMKQRGMSGDGVIEENNKRYIVYNNHRFELHENNYPKFPLPYGGAEALAPYYDTFPFLDEKWDIVMNNDHGFYFIHDEFGSMSSSTDGCFIEYNPNQMFSTEQVMRFENKECISAPTISNVELSGVFDLGATLTWQGHVAGNNYKISLTQTNSKMAPQLFTANEPEFFFSQLMPETQYQVQIQACNTTACIELEAFNFITEKEKVGFHDGTRNLNHLEGNIAAHVSFMQSHSITAPFGNEDLGAPDIVIGREAMLLVSPQQDDINQMWVEIYQDGELVTRQIMLPPANQPKTDQYAVEGRPTVIFGHNLWSLPLKWNWIKPGLSLQFVDNHGRHSELSQQNIEFGGAPELIIQNIDMGMLTQPRGRNTMANNTAEHAADYFQKIPVSKLIVGQYASAYFEKVTMPNGKVYTERSETDGGWHGGDMREAIGKALISTGINNANVGITATAGSSQAYNRHFNHITAHTNVGVYIDAETGQTETVVHGGSGGGGIVTLESTTGNEWSHELGHNYGLGHYPSMASVHDMQSGWGWDAVFKRFIGNINWRGSAKELNLGGEISPPYLDIFSFLRDAQAGGENQKMGLVSNYTYEHPMQARRTQAWLNNGYNQTPDGTSYYVKWDQEQQSYLNVESDALAAQQTGIKVTTLVGIYDPMRLNPSQIYPVLYGNYGNTFQLPNATEYTPIDSGQTLTGGWHHYQSLTEEQLALTTWKTLADNGNYKRLCQFSFTTTTGDNVNLVGHVDSTNNNCRTSDDMHWSINGQSQQMVSATGDYSLLYPLGRGQIVYTPTPEIGEVNLCLLTDINNPSHNGAGFVQGDKCSQIPGIKHSNNRDWTYTIWRNPTEQVQYSHNNVCRLEVLDKQGQFVSYDLPGQRLNSSESNKFHINLPLQELAQVTLYCEDNEGVHQLDQLTPSLDTGLESLPEAVILGQEYGYDVLNTGMGNGWFDHSAQMNYNTLTKRDLNNLATMQVNNLRLPVCRFELDIDGTTQTVHGFVEQLVTNDYRCTGGDEITVVQNGSENRVESKLNQFQWLSMWNPQHTGEQIKAKTGSEQNLCSITRSGFYGAGFINDGGQCVQASGIKWSNGYNWVFSSGHAQYTYK
ncbi:TagA-related protein [Shewanella halifaxensis HAW-EB4]|uniref:TagA-related protein n=1 Tax=Shewanella halifaxensis (strain HAW-EB4) TaxID=458817 RepID=B0TT83_SHEHH|nr:M66 family metalloprotease [Shewanella halifaxensis]ABZ78024.1 TagA-related protein [Shewanella halifaxensis HAW-EB4]